jgi:hypothetical protein
MKTKYFVFPILLLSFISCKKDIETQSDNKTVMDSTFCNRLMPDLGGGVTGADGSISIDLKNGKSLFMWGDAFFGDVKKGVRADPSPLVMGNIFTTIDDKEIKNYYNGTNLKPSSYITATPVGKFPTWYWPGNGFVRDGVVHLFMSKFHREGEGMFAFVYDTCDYLTLDANTLKELSRGNFPAANINKVHYGHAVLDDGEYIYSYGTRVDGPNGYANVHVARAILKDGKLTNWHYYTGKDWSTDPLKSVKIAGLTQSVSEQFNVIKINEKYILVTQDRTKNVKDVYSFISDKPEGNFYHEKLIFTVNEPNYDKKKMMTYNTMVHPQYIKDGKILMCYNVNTWDFFSHYKDASLYKPRFFWLPLSKILE